MMTIKASEYKDQIPLLSEDDYDKTLEELIFDYMHGDGMDDEPFEGAGYCLCHVCQVVAAVATCMHVELMDRRDQGSCIDPAGSIQTMNKKQLKEWMKNYKEASEAIFNIALAENPGCIRPFIYASFSSGAVDVGMYDEYGDERIVTVELSDLGVDG